MLLVLPWSSRDDDWRPLPHALCTLSQCPPYVPFHPLTSRRRSRVTTALRELPRFSREARVDNTAYAACSGRMTHRSVHPRTRGLTTLLVSTAAPIGGGQEIFGRLSAQIGIIQVKVDGLERSKQHRNMHRVSTCNRDRRVTDTVPRTGSPKIRSLTCTRGPILSDQTHSKEHTAAPVP